MIGRCDACGHAGVVHQTTMPGVHLCDRCLKVHPIPHMPRYVRAEEKKDEKKEWW